MNAGIREDVRCKDEEAEEGIVKFIFAEYRTDDHATTESWIEFSTPDRVSSTEDGQVPVAGTGMITKRYSDGTMLIHLEDTDEYDVTDDNGVDWWLDKDDVKRLKEVLDVW